MDRDRIYMTWPDAVFSYECRGCSECCKGLGIGLDATGGQVQRLVQLYPASAPFLRKRGTAWTAFNPRGRCWFLDDAGLCRIEADHGRPTKPASCRLFPFNRIFRLGSVTIVDYNSVICPLRALPADAPDDALGMSGRVTHEAILADIAVIADPAVVGTPLPAEDAEAEGRALLTRERAVASACFAAAHVDTPDIDTVWRAQAKEGTPEKARARVARAFELFCGVDGGVKREVAQGTARGADEGGGLRLPTGATLQAALWLTPSLRFNELYGPRRYAPRHELVHALADMWLAWLGAVAMGAELAGRELGLREVTSIWAEMMPLAFLAARWADAPTMEPGPVELPGAGDPEGLVRRFAEACVSNRSRRQPLSALASALLDGRDAAERVTVTRMLEPLLPAIRWRRPRG